MSNQSTVAYEAKKAAFALIVSAPLFPLPSDALEFAPHERAKIVPFAVPTSFVDLKSCCVTTLGCLASSVEA